MLRHKRTLGAYILASVLVPMIAAHAATYYVATTGSDSSAGTSENTPFRTIAKAVNTMVAGDTTYVRGGTYHEGVIRFQKTGTEAAPIKLLNYPGEFPIIDFVNGSAPSYDRIFIQHSAGTTFPMGWITIQGFEIRDGWEAIKFYGLHNSVFRNNWIHDNHNQGILSGSGHHNVFDRNIINNNGPLSQCKTLQTQLACTQAHGLYLVGNSYIVTNNLFYNNVCHGIQQNGSGKFDSAKHPAPEFVGALNWVISNNTFAYNYSCAGLVIWGALASSEVYNNIFYENAVFLPPGSSQTYGVRFLSTSSSNPSMIKNNIFYASGSGGTNWMTNGTEGVHFMQSGNLIGTHNPAFVNGGNNELPDSPNFALSAQSPAIDTGSALPWIKIDLKGTARPQGRAPDIGAYEYRPDGDTQSPIAPILAVH